MASCKKRMTINRRLLPVKATYFFTLAGVGSLLPYLSVYMKQVGLSASESALIYGVMPFLGALVRPLLGVCADKLQQHKAFLMGCCIVTGVLHAGLLFVPHTETDGDSSGFVNISCGENGAYLAKCDDGGTRLNCTSSADVAVNGNESCVVMCVDVDCGLSGSVSNISACNGTMRKIEFNTSQDVLYNSICDESPIVYSYGDVVTCPNSTTFQCTIDCRDKKWLDVVMCQDEPSDLGKFSSVFFMFFFIYMFAQIVFSPIINLIDAMTYVHLGDDRNKWGEQRLWGTVGYATFSVISTLYMDIFGSATKKNYTAAFLMFGINNLLAAICVCMFRISNDVSCSSMAQHLLSVLRIPRLTCLLVIVFVFGMYQGLIETFLYWHLHTLGSSQILFGLCTVMNCIPEILILSIAGRIIQVLGHIPMMSLVFVAWIVRLLCYSFLYNPWFVLAIEPLHSITFGLMYAGASSYGSQVAPPGMHGTIQGLLSGLHFGFGKGIGSVTSGYVFEHFGSVVMFQSYAVSAAVCLLLFLVTSALIMRYSQETEKPETQNGTTVHFDDGKAEKDAVQESMLHGNNQTTA